MPKLICVQVCANVLKLNNIGTFWGPWTTCNELEVLGSNKKHIGIITTQMSMFCASHRLCIISKLLNCLAKTS